MTPEQQRIAIAEACGWKVHPKDRFIVIPPNSPHSVQPLNTIPDYLNDLNAMHEAEKILVGGFGATNQIGRYIQELNKICDRDKINPVFSDSSQRAEAFLRTLNLWK